MTYPIKSVFFGLALVALAACEAEPTIDYEAQALERGAAVVAECAAVRCERLDLDGARLADFSVLNGMDHVTALMVSYSNFDDLADIAGMTQLTELHIGSTQVADLSGLSAFPNLTLLHAQSLPQTTDLAPAYAMTGLRELALDVRAADGIGYVAAMRNLQSLHLEGETIADLSPLSGHPSLQELSLYAGLPEDQQALLNMPALQRIDFHWWAASDELRAQLEAQGVEVAEPVVIVC